MQGQLQPELALLNAAVVRCNSMTYAAASDLPDGSSQTRSSTQVPDLFPLQVAAWKALTAERRGKLTTRTLHSELVFNVAGSTHVRHHRAQRLGPDSYSPAPRLTLFGLSLLRCRYRRASSGSESVRM